eukprot:635209-Prymnesium_polylepis.1
MRLNPLPRRCTPRGDGLSDGRSSGGARRAGATRVSVATPAGPRTGPHRQPMRLGRRHDA